MRVHTIETSIHLPSKIDEVFPFFCRAGNLQRITPPELDFRILTPLPITINLGTTVDYQLRLFRIPFKWRSEITVWDPPTVLLISIRITAGGNNMVEWA